MIGKRHVAIALAAFIAGSEMHARAQGNSKESTPIAIAQKDFDKVIKVKNGDLVEIRLPMLLPLVWVPQDDQPLVTKATGFPKSVSVPPDPNAPVPELGAGQFWVNRYTVTAKGQVVVPLAWVYCRKGDLALTKDRLAKGIIPMPPDYRADLKRSELREGMLFKVKLDVQP